MEDAISKYLYHLDAYRISNLPDFGAEYTIIYTIDEGRNRAGVKNKLRETIVKTMQEKGIDLTTAHIHTITQKTA